MQTASAMGATVRKEEILAKLSAGEVTTEEATELLREIERNVPVMSLPPGSRGFSERAHEEALAAFRELFRPPEARDTAHLLGATPTPVAAVPTRSPRRRQKPRTKKKRPRSAGPPPPTACPNPRQNETPQTSPPRSSVGNIPGAERKLILDALRKTGEPLGVTLMSVKTSIAESRLREILPHLVTEGLLKCLKTERGDRYSEANS